MNLSTRLREIADEEATAFSGAITLAWYIRDRIKYPRTDRRLNKLKRQAAWTFHLARIVLDLRFATEMLEQANTLLGEAGAKLERLAAEDAVRDKVNRCHLHPDVNWRTMWGCPDCIAFMRQYIGMLTKDESNERDDDRPHGR